MQHATNAATGFVNLTAVMIIVMGLGFVRDATERCASVLPCQPARCVTNLNAKAAAAWMEEESIAKWRVAR